MSSFPSLRPLYNFDGWVIKNIKLSSDVAVIKIRHDKRHFSQCPFCGQKMGEFIGQLKEVTKTGY